jgi:hypothetical protein
LLHVQLSGAILSVVAYCIAQGKTKRRELDEVLLEAEERCRAATWRQYVEKMI